MHVLVDFRTWIRSMPRTYINLLQKNAMVKKFSNQMSSFVTYIHHIYLVNVYIVLYLLYVRLSQYGLVKFMMFFNKKKLFLFCIHTTQMNFLHSPWTVTKFRLHFATRAFDVQISKMVSTYLNRAYCIVHVG